MVGRFKPSEDLCNIVDSAVAVQSAEIVVSDLVKLALQEIADFGVIGECIFGCDPDTRLPFQDVGIEQERRWNTIATAIDTAFGDQNVACTGRIIQ